ncbi:MAG: MotA/TolQ/ExbB proton channel family protein [Elusimicrobia bacterium]|nr:MotA/TolQ/ExbB proton channel family protein [Elusimicrobiota bacterium]
MDITTLIGYGAIAGMVVIGAVTGSLPAVFLNWHGLGIVVGGTICAILVNTPFPLLWEALAALRLIWRDRRYPPKRQIAASVIALSEQMHARGVAAFQEADSRAIGGYLGYATKTALEYNDPNLVDEVLNHEIDQAYDRQNEVVNVFRTMSVLAPMFGLLGTLIGIVQVLRQISNPGQVGEAMAVAITTAFYGISLANAFCLPIAGKLRLRYLEEMQAKRMVADGVVMMLRRVIPSVIERKLKSYLV